MRIDGEIWRNVPGYGGKYQVSNKGRVMSFAQKKTGVALKPQPQRGYLFVDLCDGVGGRKRYAIHRMVLDAFEGPPPVASFQAAHANGCPTDNRASNLRWASPKDNHSDKRRHGTHMIGSSHPAALLTPSQVSAIRSTDRPGRDLAREFGVSESAISNARVGKTWSHMIPTVKARETT